MADTPRQPARLHFAASPRLRAQRALRKMRSLYEDAGQDEAEVIVALGGDGFMLETLHHHMGQGTPIYGVNCGSVGFLMNDYAEDGLHDRLANAERALIRPLRAKGRDVRDRPFNALAINELSLLRQTRQTAKITISINAQTRIPELVADGVIVATAAGSSAYNFSAHGPILPINSRILALTPISAFRPRRWSGALLPHTTKVRFDILEPDTRPVSATADNQEFRDIHHVEIEEDPTLTQEILFDAGRALDERLLTEQFAH